jgi:hypothetical protein
VPLARLLALSVLAAACAGPGRTLRGDLAFVDLQARLAATAAALEGRAGEFQVRGVRFNADCSGFVEAVYEAEGVPLRRLMAIAAPRASSGVEAAFHAMERFGTVTRDTSAWPAPGDLVFFDDTYDRNGDGVPNDPLTHVGVVEWVENGTVVFMHRGGRAVARAAMTPGAPAVAASGERVLNSPLRDKRAAASRAWRPDVLAGALFAAYGRLDPAKLPPDVSLDHAPGAAGAGGESTPSSATCTAAAPKSSCESRRTTGITAPAGSR